MHELLVVDLGLIEYGAAWERQRRVVAARKAGAIPTCCCSASIPT